MRIMTRGIRLYLYLLTALVLGWLVLRAETVLGIAKSTEWPDLLGICGLYFLSHAFRMLRLALLSLDQRRLIVSLIAAHSLTAFPSSFMPFKIGEILRLAGFFSVFTSRRRAFALWLVERFGDVVVIAVFILGLYAFNIIVPASIRTVLILFIIASSVGILGMFATASVLVFLNRHLVLSSLSARGLLLLRISYVLRQLELDIRSAVEGRFVGLMLLSGIIWSFEILALSLFIRRMSVGGADFSSMFAAALLASLPGTDFSNSNLFGYYQSLVLVILTLMFLWMAWIVHNRNSSRQ
ncbi:MAG: hypothetical protein A3H93_19600 [Rhodocyclales bacterium RIFCSPLOWO2_02_FULL_63_24]|nr:MAG: hypothetical protein A3H93_19600 [Rhodocyclales bacterium RIFCSPLOWO2_02_FULL_63_24]